MTIVNGFHFVSPFIVFKEILECLIINCQDGISMVKITIDQCLKTALV